MKATCMVMRPVTRLEYFPLSLSLEGVRFKVLYCGICHSDVKNDWGINKYPVVGVVTEVGSKAEKFKIGDKVGVGCLVGSCRSCQSWASDYEEYLIKLQHQHRGLLILKGGLKKIYRRRTKRVK
ncbi:putative 8-hydroxygeraniol dehydrogenase [Helianthus debilis subsp. tardiflorus]